MVDYVLHILVMLMIFCILGISFNFIMGYAGIISLGHAAFFGVGSFTSAVLMLRLGMPFPIALIGAIVLTSIFGAAFIWVLRKARGDYLVVMTLGLQVMVGCVFLNWNLTGAEIGLTGIPRPELFGFRFDSPTSYVLLAGTLFAACLVFGWWIARSPFGRSLKAIREDELAAESLGKNVFWYKVVIFAISSGMAAVAGSMYAHYQQYINGYDFPIFISIFILIIVIMGGAGNFWGPLVGVLILVSLTEVLRLFPITTGISAQIREVIYGVALILLVYFRPQGVIGEYNFGALESRQERARLDQKSLIQLQQQMTVTFLMGNESRLSDSSVPILQVSNLSKRFGGIEAVQDISFALQPGKIVGIIGPNGAGKTTLFNLICGYLTPDKGEVCFKGRNVTNLAAHETALLGIGRSFQDLRLFRRMTVLDNIVVALQRPKQDETMFNTLVFAPKTYRKDMHYREQGCHLLDSLGLADRRNELAENLSFAEQKLLVVARLLASKAELLLLDELASGMDLESVHSLSELLKQLVQGGGGKTICLVEHSLDFVRESVDTILFLDQGSLIAQGPPDDIVKDPKLAKIYFGSVK